VGAARGAVIIGTFDPAFASSPDYLSNMGFEGKATFFVPDACLAQTGIVVNGSAPCTSGNPIQMLAATVNLYAIAQPGIFLPVEFPQAQTLGQVNFVDVVAGEIAGVDTNIIGSQDANVPGVYVGSIWLQFTDPGIDPAFIYACPGYQDGTSFAECSSEGSIRSAAATVKFTLVPEPSSSALMLGALSAAAFAARRRRAGIVAQAGRTPDQLDGSRVA